VLDAMCQGEIAAATVSRVAAELDEKLAEFRGRRLDHVWVSRDLSDGLLSQTVLKEARDWPQASDHVPVCVELEI